MSSLLERLNNVLVDDAKPVTSRWLCFEHAVSTGTAQTALKECAQGKEDICITYIISGILKASGHQAVKLVPEEKLAMARAAFEEGANEAIYALAPRRQPVDAQSMHVQSIEQARKLMASVVKGEKDDKVAAFATNGCSSVHSSLCRRRENEKPPIENVPSAASGAAAPHSKSATVSRPPLSASSALRSASAAAKMEAPAPVATDAIKAEGGPAAHATSAAPSKSTASKASNALASAFSRAPARPPNKSKAAECSPAKKPTASGHTLVAAPSKNETVSKEKVAPAKQQVLDDDDDDDMESDSPLRTRTAAAAASGRKRQVVLEDDSDDDFVATACPPAPSKSHAAAARACTPVQTKCNDAPEVPSKRQAEGSDLSTAAAKKVRSTPVPRSPQAPAHPATEDSKPAAPEAPCADAHTVAGAHPIYGVPPHPDAEIEMVNGRPVWLYISEKGEEVTVAAGKAHGAAPPPRSSSAAAAVKAEGQRSSAAGEKAAASSATAASKPPGVAKKKKGAGKQAGMGDIRSMFGGRK